MWTIIIWWCKCSRILPRFFYGSCLRCRKLPHVRRGWIKKI